LSQEIPENIMNGTKTENFIAKECFLLLGALPVRKVKNLKCVIFKDKKGKCNEEPSIFLLPIFLLHKL
jgi:hypothetical protein